MGCRGGNTWGMCISGAQHDDVSTDCDSRHRLGPGTLCSSAPMPASGHPSSSNRYKEICVETTNNPHGDLKQFWAKRYKQTKTQLPVLKSLEQKHVPCTRYLLRVGTAPKPFLWPWTHTLPSPHIKNQLAPTLRSEQASEELSN